MKNWDFEEGRGNLRKISWRGQTEFSRIVKRDNKTH